VTSRPEDVEAAPALEEDRGLAVAHDQLGAELGLAGALRRNAVHDLEAGVIEPLDDLHEL